MSAHPVIYKFTKEKLDEFRDIPVKTRLRWLLEANRFINKTLGLEKRAVVDERFKVFLDKERGSHIKINEK